jgi:hypothetical protein
MVTRFFLSRYRTRPGRCRSRGARDPRPRSIFVPDQVMNITGPPVPDARTRHQPERCSCYDRFMRIGAAVLLAALLFPSLSAVIVSSAPACCCTARAGASCPLKRSSHPCQSQRGASCDLRSAEPFAASLPEAGNYTPALLPGGITSRAQEAAVRFDLPVVSLARGPSQAPEPPPPRIG